jgi:dinuclear metal center YbgI/SA1388 family protein
MTTTIAAVAEVIEALWPRAGAESWDSVGLVSGSPSAKVDSILLAVDPVSDSVNEAVTLGVDLLITHHPLLLRGVTSVAEDAYKGAMLATLIRNDCALIAAHTNADVVASGTSATLAQLLGLTDIAPLDQPVDATAPASTTGIGRVGRLAQPLSLGRLARMLADLLPATATGVRVAGDYDAEISSVALCAGAGDAYLASAAVTSADVYITSDLRHHPASEARETAKLRGGPALIDISHWASEWLWLETAASELATALPGVHVVVSELRTDPWDFVVTQ